MTDRTVDNMVIGLLVAALTVFIVLSFWFMWQQIELNTKIAQLNICAVMEHPEQNPKCAEGIEW